MDQTELIFKQLFSAEYGKLCRHALTYMQDEQAAEDVVQDTFIKIWETKRELISSPEVKYYLITAVRNNCISALRKQKSSAVHYTDEMPEPEPEPHFTRQQLLEDATSRQQKIAKALEALPPKCKEVFLMTKMNNMSYKQVAEALEISIKTVENQMGKALRMLRESSLLILIGAALVVNAAQGIGVWLMKHVLL